MDTSFRAYSDHFLRDECGLLPAVRRMAGDARLMGVVMRPRRIGEALRVGECLRAGRENLALAGAW